jgi:hypothetical protein
VQENAFGVQIDRGRACGTDWDVIWHLIEFVRFVAGDVFVAAFALPRLQLDGPRCERPYGADRGARFRRNRPTLLTSQRSYARNPSKIIWSAKRAAIARSCAPRTVHVSSGNLNISRTVRGVMAPRSSTR